MTIQEKVKSLRPKLALYRDEAVSNTKKWSFGLLHDALIFTNDDEIDAMEPKSLAFFIEMMACAQIQDDPDPRAVRHNLLRAGFRVTPRVSN